MIQFFVMIVDFVEKIFGFFKKTAVFGSSFSLFEKARLAFRISYLALFYASWAVMMAVLVAFVYFAIDSIVTVFNLINQIILMIGNGGSSSSSSIMSGFYYFLNVTGISTGLSAAFPFVMTALTFRLTIYLYKVTLYFFFKISGMFTTYVKMATF